MIYDILIIGGGTASLSAAVYASRKARHTLVIAKKIGGQTAIAGLVENYPGFKQIQGVELSLNIKSQAEHLGATIIDGEIVEKITKNEHDFTVKTDKNHYKAKTIIIASGKKPRQLQVTGEKEFLGRGVAYCATCDAPMFKNKTVVVAGGGNSGFDAAEELLKYAKKIYILEFAPECIGDKLVLDKLKKHKKVSIITNAQITNITGDKFVKVISYKNRVTNKITKILAEGLFVEIGWEVVSDFVPKEVKKNKAGEIIVDHKTCATNIAGIFAAGDVTDNLYKQAVTAAAQGAISAISADEYLKKNN